MQAWTFPITYSSSLCNSHTHKTTATKKAPIEYQFLYPNANTSLASPLLTVPLDQKPLHEKKKQVPQHTSLLQSPSRASRQTHRDPQQTERSSSRDRGGIPMSNYTETFSGTLAMAYGEKARAGIHTARRRCVGGERERKTELTICAIR